MTPHSDNSEMHPVLVPRKNSVMQRLHLYFRASVGFKWWPIKITISIAHSLALVLDERLQVGKIWFGISCCPLRVDASGLHNLTLKTGFVFSIITEGNVNEEKLVKKITCSMSSSMVQHGAFEFLKAFLMLTNCEDFIVVPQAETHCCQNILSS